MKERDTIHHRGAGWRRDDIHLTPDVSYIKNPDVAHEHSDVSVGPIAKFVIGLFIFGAAVLLLMWGLFRYFEDRERTAEPPPSPLARKGAERLPPDPRLQASKGFQAEGVNLELKEPQAEMRVVREKWERDLHSYGWVDQTTGAVRLPIEEAKRLYAEREAAKATGGAATSGTQPPGTPQQQRQGAQPAEGETIPSGSSAGQKTEKRNQ